MNVTLLPAISGLNPKSLCFSIYNQLYANFFQAQDKKDASHPYGILEGDELSVRLRNTAYNFADAISGAIHGEGNSTEGNVFLDFLKKSGGDMSGSLTSNYGFEAGIENTKVIEIFARAVTNSGGQVISKTYGIKITGDIEIGGNSLFIAGKQLLSFNSQTNTATLSNPTLSFANSTILSQGEFIIGNDKQNGVYLSSTVLQINGKDVYHAGNANLESINWIMQNAIVARDLSVNGKSELFGGMSALFGVELGINSNVILSIKTNGVTINSFLSFGKSFGIKINGIPVLLAVNNTDIQLGASGGDLLLGSSSTNKTKLISNMTDVDGSYVLLSKYGAAYFPDSLTVSHNFGNKLLSSYRVDNQDEGMVIHQRLRFGSPRGAYLLGQADGICFISTVEHLNVSTNQRMMLAYDTLILYEAATSRYKNQSSYSDSLSISTTADFVCFGKPIEAKGHVGIDNSFTRLTDGGLFFDSERYLLAATGGIKHYGNAFFLADISSERFSSGFAGSGWAISQNKTSGNVAATFDELTIRKKMRIYELEVQKISATNGSLWVSDNCQGDTVVKL